MTRKVDQTGLVFGLRRGFISRSTDEDYKSLCAAVTIFTTLVDPKLDFYILTPVTLKSKST